MPSEGVEIVRRGYEAYEARGIEGILEFLDPEIEWRNPTDSPIAGVFQGHEGVREWQRQADEAWDPIRHGLRGQQEFASIGQLLRLRGRSLLVIRALALLRCVSRTQERERGRHGQERKQER